MKIKCQPEDFRVEELTGVQPSRGAFAFYRLSKQSIGTPEAVEAICRRWNIPGQQLSYGGMKDRHADTAQYLTIHRGPQQNLRQTNFSLEYLGQVPRPFGPTDILANRFRIVLRDIAANDAPKLVDTLVRIGKEGMPNYFDEQRFGSLGNSRQFIAQPWCLGDYERALWLALADDNRHDRPDEQEQKKILRDLWGKWPEAKEALARSNRRSVVTYLVDHPQDFRRAFALIRVDLRRIYLAAFQSHLWNQILDRWLRQQIAPERLFDVELGGSQVAFWRELNDDEHAKLTGVALPLPTARNQNLPDELQPIVQSVMETAGLELRELRVKYPRDSFFSKGERAAVLQPKKLTAKSGNDKLYPGRHSVLLEMDLPRGSYATILAKRLSIGSLGPQEAF